MIDTGSKKTDTRPPDAMDFLAHAFTFLNEIWQNMFFDALEADKYRNVSKVEALL